MIAVEVYRADRLVSQVFDIEDAETAVFAAQTLWDDAVTAMDTQGATRAMRVVFSTNGVLVRMIEGRRPS
jgi:hypothetical protein